MSARWRKPREDGHAIEHAPEGSTLVVGPMSAPPGRIVLVRAGLPPRAKNVGPSGTVDAQPTVPFLFGNTIQILIAANKHLVIANRRRCVEF